jgi:two-component system cell cycle sensor histidine kinase/response regulator CckA
MGLPIRVLMIEDSESDAALIVRELERGGFEVTPLRVDSPAAMNTALEGPEWDLVISDYSMPHFSGTDALKLLRSKWCDVPFIFLSGTIGEEIAVAAMRNGAQDYFSKSNMKRLAPAVHRELKESEQRRERKRLEAHVILLQKFEAIGRLAGGIAHDFNNVIGAILGSAELGHEEAQNEPRLQKRFVKIRDQANWAARLTSQLLAFARRQVLQPRRINLNDLIEESIKLLRRVIGEHIEVRIVAAPNLRVALADPAQIEQVLMNLCLNARDAMPDGGQLIVETQNVEIGDEHSRLHTNAQPGSYIQLSVSDTGKGMDAGTAERIFEPFFTTKEMGRGTGLGLATVYGIVKQHNGFVYVYTEPGKGTSFRVYFPASSGVVEKQDRQPDLPPQRGSETILLAEDNVELRELGQEMLAGLGYRVILATDGKDAIQQFKLNTNHIDLVILDVVMPGLGGPDAFREISAIRPGQRVIFITGYTSEAAEINSLLEAGAVFLQKPYSRKSLSSAIRGALDRKRPA